MKILKKLSVIMLSFLLIAFLFSGCNKVNNSQSDIEISYWRAGLGSEFMEKIIEAFENEHDEYNLIFNYSADYTILTNTLKLGGDYNTIDIYFATTPTAKFLQYAEPLNDILTYTNDGETKTIGEKYNKSFLSAMQSNDGNYYSLSYGGGWGGLSYNADIIDGIKYKVPMTTNELEILAIELNNDGYTPFIHYVSGGYWSYVYNVWQAQYDGLDYYNNTFYASTDDITSPNKDIMLKADGRKQVLDYMERIITSDYVEASSNISSFTDAQTRFIEGKAVMMANGSWLQNEMKTSGGAEKNILMMKVPVISSITDKCDTISDDVELSALIKVIDAAGADFKSIPLTGVGYDVSQADLDRIYEARNIMSSNLDGHGIVIPNYANAKEGAKEFVKFFYSDKAMKIYLETLHLSLPLSFSDGSKADMTKFTNWEKQQYSFFDTAIPLMDITGKKHDIFTLGGATPYAGIDFISKFCSRGNDRKTASQIWNDVIETINDRWENYLSTAELK